jgi:hypothetical protein
LTTREVDTEIFLAMADESRLSHLDIDTSGPVSLHTETGAVFRCSSDLTVACERRDDELVWDQTKLSCRPGTLDVPRGPSLTWQSHVVLERLRLKDDSFESTFSVSTSNPKPVLIALAGKSFVKHLGIALLPLGKLDATGHISGAPSPLATKSWLTGDS